MVLRNTFVFLWVPFLNQSRLMSFFFSWRMHLFGSSRHRVNSGMRQMKIWRIRRGEICVIQAVWSHFRRMTELMVDTSSWNMEAYDRGSPWEGLCLLRSYCAIGKMLLETINGFVKKRKWLKGLMISGRHRIGNWLCLVP